MFNSDWDPRPASHIQPAEHRGTGPGLLIFLFLLQEGTQVTSGASLATSPEGHFWENANQGDSDGGFIQLQAA